MTISIDEFRSRPREAALGQSRLNELKGMAQEIPRMAALTGSAEWDYFSRYVEAHIKSCERQIETKRNQAAALVLVDTDKARAAAVIVMTLEAKAETLRELILIPKWIVENGAAAQKLVAELEASL